MTGQRLLRGKVTSSKVVHDSKAVEAIVRRSVFISHSSKDKKAANSVRELLEDRGWKCWIAPRDIRQSHGIEIPEGIECCSVTLLLLTENSNASDMVANEIALSLQYQKPVIPLRLKNVAPAKRFHFFLANTQYVDAFEAPLRQRIEEVINIVRAVETNTPPPPPAPEKKTVLGSIERHLESILRYKLISAICIILVFGGFGLSIYGSANRVDAAVSLEKSTIEQDPSTLGLVRLTSINPKEGAVKSDAIDIWTAVYLNAKGTSFSDVKLTAITRTDSNAEIKMDLSERVAKGGALDAQTFTFSVPRKSEHIQVCLTAIHPTLKERYTAIWSYRIEQVGGSFNLTKDRAAWMEKSSPADCSADGKIPRV